MKISKKLNLAFYIILVIGFISSTTLQVAYPESKETIQLWVVVSEAIAFILLFSIATKELKDLGY